MAAESDASVLVARCLGDDTSARRPRETAPRTNPEVHHGETTER
jgi:hypothetical protein